MSRVLKLLPGLTAAIILFATAGIVHATEPPSPGTVLDAGNVSEYASYLDETLIDLIGEGYFTIEVTTSESFPVHPAYAAATNQYAGQTRLGDRPGKLHDYIAGRPFPDPPSTDDPRAGDKLAWNMRYAFAGDGGRIKPFYWQYRNMRTGKVERELSFAAASLRFKHRTISPPLPDLPRNPSGIFNALYLHVLAPPDIRHTQVLIHRLEDDTRQEEGWLYLSVQRRVRRLPTGQNTDAFLGSDIMIEDFLGYSGRIKDMEWSFGGVRHILLPMYRHDQIEVADKKARRYDHHFVDFEGHSGCFPKVTWQVRKVYILEGTPKRSDHPLSKRFFYVDAQTLAPVFGKVYDRGGVLWKYLMAGLAHPDSHLEQNYGSGVPMFDSSAVIDVQNMHCTTLQMITLANMPKMKQRDFEPSSLNVGAR